MEVDKAYEAAVLDALARRLDVGAEGTLRHEGRVIRETWVEGSSPERELVIAYDDEVRGDGLSKRWTLDSFKTSSGAPGNPEAIATIVLANLEEIGHELRSKHPG